MSLVSYHPFALVGWASSGIDKKRRQMRVEVISYVVMLVGRITLLNKAIHSLRIFLVILLFLHKLDSYIQSHYKKAFTMKDLNRYSSIQEMKNNSKSTESTIIESMDRHERFADALRMLRVEYLQSIASSDTHKAVSGK
jgi:hypothetical protein